MADTPGNLIHELVHAARDPAVRKPHLLEEGAAESFSAGGLSSYRVDFARSVPLVDLLAVDLEDLDFSVVADGGHFVSWLRQRYGDPTVVAMLNDSENEDIDALFVRHFDATVAELDEAWKPVAKQRIVIGEPCASLDVYEMPVEVSLDAMEMDCSEPEVRGPRGPLGGSTINRYFCLDVATEMRGRLSITSETGSTNLVVFQTSPECLTGDSTEDDKRVEPNSELDVTFAPCRWTARIRTQGDGPDTVSVSVVPLDGE